MFLTNLDVRVVSDGKYALLRPLAYRHPKTHRKYVVPSGFITDFASIPRPFRFLVTGHDRTRKPAVLHDYLVSKPEFPRSRADDLFNQAMKDEKVKPWRRHLCYRAVQFYTWLISR